jgi:hypothetical protein
MARKRTEDYLADLSNLNATEVSDLTQDTFGKVRLSEGPIVQTDTVEESINEFQTGVPSSTPTATTTDISTEAAADILLSKLEPSIRNYAIELADLVLKIPRWQLVLGSLMCQYQSGSLVAPYIDPSWQVQQIAESSAKCEKCGEVFIPKRLKQRFCSNACGSAAILERKGVIGANP